MRTGKHRNSENMRKQRVKLSETSGCFSHGSGRMTSADQRLVFLKYCLHLADACFHNTATTKNVAFVYAFKSFCRFEISEFQALNQHISTLKSARNQLPTGSSSLSELNSTRQGRCSSAWKLERSVHGALELLGALEAELSEVIGKTYSKNGSNDSNWFKTQPFLVVFV